MSDDWNEIKIIGGRPMYYGRKGEPLSLRQWAEYSEDLSYRRVAYDEIPATTMSKESYLSTVWLGLDHSFMLNGPPLIFETMRFEKEPKPSQFFSGTYHESIDFPDPEDPKDWIDCERYSTEEMATLGHRRILRLIQEREMQ
jgi:hypothetical protein